MNGLKQYRGRRSGQEPTKLHAKTNKIQEHHKISRYGNYHPQAFQVAEWLPFLVKIRKQLEAMPDGAERNRLLSFTLLARQFKIYHRNGLLALTKCAVLGIAVELLNATERKDVRFFHDLERCMKRPDPQQPAEPIHHALATFALQTGKWKEASFASLDRFVRAKNPTYPYSERTLRRAAKQLGFTFKSRGRPPKKSGN